MISVYIETCSNVQYKLGAKADTSIVCESDTSVIDSYVNGHVEINSQYLSQFFNLD